MKSLGAGYLTHIAGGRTTLSNALRITRGDSSDADVLGFTDYDRDIEIDGVVYSSNPGLELSSGIVITSGVEVGTFEITTFNDGVVFVMADIMNGKWRNARFLLFRFNNTATSERESILAGVVSDIKVFEGRIVAELRDLRQYLQQPIGELSSRTCRYRLGDSRCGKDLTSFTVTGTITHVTSGESIRDSTRGESADYFSEGEIEILSGTSAGERRKIRVHAANGTFSLAIPIYSTIEVGSSYRAVAGCQKRFTEDCVAKFGNGRRFGGEPHRRGPNSLIRPGE